MSFITNENKIEKIISKYKDSRYKYVDNLYEDIMFIKHNRYYLNVDEENISGDMKFVTDIFFIKCLKNPIFRTFTEILY